MISGETKEYMRAELNQFKAELGEHLAQTIQGAVKATVNGKIDRLSDEIKDIRLKIETFNPVIDWYNNLSFFNQTIFWILKIITSIGVAASVLWGAIILLKQFLLK